MRKYFLLSALFLLVPSLASATERYVDSDCSNGISTYHPVNNACTGGSSLVYSTIQNCANVAVAGDTCHIRTGTYATFNVVNSGSSGNPITFRGYQSEIVTMTGTSARGDFGVDLFGNDWIVIDGFNITGFEHGVLIYPDSDDNIVRNTTVRNSYMAGINMSTNSDRNRLTNVTVTNVGRVNFQPTRGTLASGECCWPVAVASRSNCHDNIIEDSFVYWNHGEGIGQSLGSSGLIVRRNFIADNWATNVYIDGGANAVVERNFIYLTTEAKTWPNGAANNNNAIGILSGVEFGGSNIANLKVRNNVVVNCRFGYRNWVQESNHPYTNNSIENNTLVNNDFGMVLDSDLTIQGNSFRNNVIRMLSGAVVDIDGTGTNTWSNNLYYSPSATPFIRNGGALSFAGWQSSTGESSAVFAEPQLVSHSAALLRVWQETGQSAPASIASALATVNNYALTASSQGVNSGATLSGFTDDYAGSTRAVPWDRGALEFGGAGSSITLLTPNGGQSWQTGSTQTATWTSVGNSGTVDLTEDQDGNGSYETLVANDTADDGSHSFTVTGAANANRKMQVCDSDGTPCDVSDAVYAVTAAAGGTITKRISDNTTGTKVGDITGTADQFNWLLNPTTNYGSRTDISPNKVNAGDHSHGLLKFTGLSQIPSTATVTTVTFGIYLEGGGTATAQTFDFRRLLRNWTETGATWNQYSAGNNWTTAGGLGAATDRVSTASGQLTGVTLTAGYYTVTDASGSLKSDVQGWINGSLSNFGWHYERNGAGNDGAYRVFRSREGTDGTRPYLEVTYTLGAESITVTSPITGDYYAIGQIVPLAFSTSAGVSGNLKVEVSTDNGTNWRIIFASIPFNASNVPWVAEAPSSSDVLFKITSLNDTSVSGTSGKIRIGGTFSAFTAN